MADIDGYTHLDLLFQKALRYEHHQKNFKESLSNDVTPFGLRIKKTPAIETVNDDFHMKWHSILKNAEKQLIELLLFESETMVAKIQFEVDMSIKALFPDDQGEVKNILREKNQNIEKQLKQRRQKKWKKFIDRPNYGYYVPNKNPGEKSVIDPTKMMDRIQPVNDVKRELHKNITVRRGKKKSYAEIVRGCSSKNNEGLSSSEELVSMDNLNKNSIYAMEINNGVGNIGLSEHHKKVIKVHESTVLERGCDGNMTKLQSFNEQEPRIKNTECEEITSEEGKDAVITWVV